MKTPERIKPTYRPALRPTLPSLSLSLSFALTCRVVVAPTLHATVPATPSFDTEGAEAALRAMAAAVGDAYPPVLALRTCGAMVVDAVILGAVAMRGKEGAGVAVVLAVLGRRLELEGDADRVWFCCGCAAGVDTVAPDMTGARGWLWGQRHLSALVLCRNGSKEYQQRGNNSTILFKEETEETHSFPGRRKERKTTETKTDHSINSAYSHRSCRTSHGVIFHSFIVLVRFILSSSFSFSFFSLQQLSAPQESGREKTPVVKQPERLFYLRGRAPHTTHPEVRTVAPSLVPTRKTWGGITYLTLKEPPFGRCFPPAQCISKDRHPTPQPGHGCQTNLILTTKFKALQADSRQVDRQLFCTPVELDSGSNPTRIPRRSKNEFINPSSACHCNPTEHTLQSFKHIKQGPGALERTCTLLLGIRQRNLTQEARSIRAWAMYKLPLGIFFAFDSDTPLSNMKTQLAKEMDSLAEPNVRNSSTKSLAYLLELQAKEGPKALTQLAKEMDSLSGLKSR
ncbi:hypothetical protein C8F04DRAFT_1243305 [Mycena alexandri]|uniref:Uncharacterized protein n=1 Tax=Mycena alexandri TaxID=1745969 RepID=A0AAD6RZ87_9AGAR|nr:hypothetical protein C8F04DRAFT_1243305 [Mycena alexandri]